MENETKQYDQIGYLILYHVRGCHACGLTMELLERYNQEYVKQEVGEITTPERLQEMYPDQQCCPLLVKDGQPIGGIVEAIQYLKKIGYIVKKSK